MPFGLSDHDSITFSVAIENSVQKKESQPDVLDWTKTNWSAFINFCHSLDWDELIDDSMCADELWAVFTSTLKIGMSKFVPLRKSKNVKPKQKYQSKRGKKQKATKLKFWTN